MTVISASGIKKAFRGFDALNGIDLQVPRGTVFALLGENGAGKTTLIRILTGFLKPDSGTASVLGLDPQQHALEIRRRIGYVSDQPALYDWMRVGEIGWFTSSFFPDGFIKRFEQLMTGFEVPMGQQIKHLSKGQRAKVALALSIAHEPELLILDEPTSGLDPLVRRQFLESMVERAATGRTVLLSSHQISEVERVADWVAILHQGKVRLAKPLEDLKQAVVEWTVKLTDPVVRLPLLDSEVLSQTTSGRECRIVVYAPQREDFDRLRAATGVMAIDERHLSLEDIFVACTRGTAPSPPPSDIGNCNENAA